MFLVTNRPTRKTNWVPPDALEIIMDRGITVNDKWWWMVQSLQDAVILKTHILEKNVKANPPLKLFIKLSQAPPL
jgi:hypothetical protein